MPQSIRVFSYPYPLSFHEIQNTLEKNREIHYTKKDKMNLMDDLPLTATITSIKKTDSGITGHIDYQYQQLIYKDTENEKDFILTEPYDFLISPTQKCFIISGTSLYRDTVARLLDQTLHPAEEEDETPGKGKEKTKAKEPESDFRQILINKEQMYKLVMRIKEFNLENDVERPNFEFIGKKLDDLDDIDYSRSGTCITAHPYFKKHYPLATYWSPKMRIKKCNGIVDDPQTRKVGLKLGKFADFSLTQSASPKGWYRFVFETCKKIGII